jgi:putative oxidoreductase
MKVLDALFPDPVDRRASYGLLIVRLVFGLGLANHGLHKIENPLHWMDGGENPPPAVLQALAAVAEFFGGIGIAFGALTPIAAFGIIATMAVAIGKHVSKGDDFVRGWELAALYLTAHLGLLVAGPGQLSIDALIARRLHARPTP